MGTLSGGNGGGWPPDELPDLPPEWGEIVIPDDASELARESTRVRRQLRRQTREQTWRRRLRLPPAAPRHFDDDSSALGVPLLVISIAVIATLTSLFAIAWPTRTPRPDLRPSAVATTPMSTPAGGPPANVSPTAGTGSPGAASPSAAGPGATAIPHALGLTDVPLFDPAGAPLRLSGSLPAVVLLVDGCDCAQLVAATAIAAAAINPAVNTVAVGTDDIPAVGPAPTAATTHLRAVADPGGVIRAELPATGQQPSALLVGTNAALVRVVTAVRTVDDFRADLAKLA